MSDPRSADDLGGSGPADGLGVTGASGTPGSADVNGAPGASGAADAPTIPLPRGMRMRRPRPPRGARESLLSIVLVLEAIMVFFPMLVVFGKHELPPAAAFGGGIGFMVVLAIASRSTGRRGGELFGWALQAAILATGIVEPFMFVVGAMFLAFWIFCFVKGGQLDRTNAARDAAFAEQADPGTDPLA